MKKVVIELPSIRDDDSGNKYLIRLAGNMMLNPMCHYDFDFKKCSILDQNAVAMLGGLARYISAKSTLASRGLSGLIFPRFGVMFLVDTMNQLVREQLIKNNFLSHFTQEKYEGYPKGDYIGYREHTEYLDVNAIAAHLYDEWLSGEKLSISPDLKNAIISRIFEIYANAYGHGVEKHGAYGVGVISCGQFKKKEGELRLTVLDFGNGIVNNVKSYLEPGYNDENAMIWALESGHSTKTDSLDDIPRGLGFGLLNDFVSLNEGGLSVYSNTCCAHANKTRGYDVTLMKNSFQGTMVSISINCDDKHYRFTEEDTSEQYF